MRIKHTTELYSEDQRERWSSHQWYFLYKIITFFDVLLLVTKAIQRQTKPQEEVEKKKQRKLRRAKNWRAKITIELFRKMSKLSFVTDWKISFLEILSETSLLSNGHQYVERNFISRLLVLFACCLSTPGKELYRLSPRGHAFLG